MAPHRNSTRLITRAEGNAFNIEITPDLLLSLRADLSEVFDFPSLDSAHQKKVKAAGYKEYSWVNRPEVPLLVQAVHDCDSWAAALGNNQPLHNPGALGPFVRLGMAIRFGRGLRGGLERLEELRRLAAGGDFKQMLEKAFEFEVAYNFGGPASREDLQFGHIGGNPDLWLGMPGTGLPLESKVVSGTRHPSSRCLGTWRNLVVFAVKEMERQGVSAGICLRAQDDFGPEHRASIENLAANLITKLSAAPDETWAVSPDESGMFLVYGYRLCAWGTSRPPFAVDFGLDGDVAVSATYDPAQNVLKNPYFLALKFQAPDLMAGAVLRSFKVASEQIGSVNPDGPGLAVLKINAPRPGDLFEIDRALRRTLVRRRHVSAALLMWDESNMLDDGQPSTVLLGFTLKSYLIVNDHARVRIEGWEDSKARYFPQLPGAVLRGPTGELVPFDRDQELRIIKGGTVLPKPDNPNSVVLRAKPESMPPFPHVVPDSPGLTESEGENTFLWRFAEPLVDGLFQLPYDEVVLEWLIFGATQFRIYRDRYKNLRVQRRSTGFQDNVAIDLVPFGQAKDICLQLAWTPNELTARLECIDGWPPVLCRAARSPLT